MKLIDLHKIPYGAFCGDYDDLVDALCFAPTVDAVPVVRCEDCKYSKWTSRLDGTKVDTVDGSGIS